MSKEFEVTIKVTKEELDSAQFGTIHDAAYIVDKVVKEAEKVGYKW